MARLKIREFDAKNLLAQYCLKHAPQLLSNPQMLLITPNTNLDTLPQEHLWLTQTKLVAKPDQLFGKRKKLNLVLLNASWEETKQYLSENRSKTITIGKATDKLTHFLIEPYVEHKQEYYLAFSSERDKDLIYFSNQGGIDIEENWHRVMIYEIPTLIPNIDFENLTEFVIKPIPPFQNSKLSEMKVPQHIDDPLPKSVIPFIKTMFNAFKDLDFTYLEFNPFTITNKIHLLDTVAIVDDYAAYKHNWGTPAREFGKKSFPQEEYIEQLNQNSGASLKLTILNPQGKIWNILGGGGASIIYLDMLSNLGKGTEIGNYGESSGNPTTSEFYEYTKTILDCMLQNNTKGKILFIVGGIANFTDVQKTFAGCIRALQEYHQKLKDAKIHICVRRGGPNYETGLAQIETAAKQLCLDLEVYGPSTPMPQAIANGVKALP